MALRYPLEFNTGMPFIHFMAYKYNCPIPNISTLNNLKDREFAGITIALYTPGDFSENIVSSWSPEDVWQGGGGTLSGNIVSNAEKAMQSLDGGKAMASVKAGVGKLPFPMDINVFRGVEPMNLNLNFNMIPYSEGEANKIMEIIATFKKAQIPMGNEGTGGLSKNVVLNFPPVWDLTFDGMNGPGLTTPKVYENMCLTSCNVSYLSGTEGASIYHDGNPTQVKLSLGFTALRKHFIGS